MNNLSEADIQLLEDYWNDQLEATARKDLEQRLEADPDFAAAAAEWQLVVVQGFGPPAAEQEELAAIKARLQAYAETDTEADPPTAKIRRLPRRQVYFLLVTAAVLLLLMVFTPLQRVFKPADPYAEYFTHLSRDNANLSDETEAAREAYDQKNYQTAYPALLADVAAGGDSLNLIYAGVAAIGSGQPEQAISIFEPLAGSASWRLYQAEIEWYLALAYVKAGDRVRTETLLEKIAAAPGPYAIEAKRLRAAIE